MVELAIAAKFSRKWRKRLMDSLHLAIALAPLAAHLLVLGVVNLSSRPLITTGSRDTAALVIAVSGLVIVGPMELFLVEEAAALYGVWVWAIMLVAYGLVTSLIVLLLRPRLIVYNITAEQLRPLLVDVVSRLDAEAQWAGESVTLPRLGVQLHLDAAALLKTVSLVASGPDQSQAGWRQIEAEMRVLLRRQRTGANPLGITFVSCAILIAAAVTFALARNPDVILQAMNEMLRK